MRERPLHIALLACNKQPARFAEDASYRYRCDNLAGALRDLGHHVTTCHHRQWPRGVRPDVVVVHRPRLDLALACRLAGWRARGVTCVADFDDLIFDPALAPLSPGVLNGRVSERFMRGQFRRSALALRAFDGYTVSTEPLAQALRQAPGAAGRPVQVLPNAVHGAWRRLPAWVPEPRPPAPVMRYLPGTPSHDRDFALIAPALRTVLAQVPQARLEIVGPLALGRDWPEGRVSQQPRLPFDQYHTVFPGARLNLAPLEATPFTHCKSAVKVMEAGWWGVPTLASASPDVERFVGAGAWVARDPAQWVSMAVDLLTDDDRYRAAVAGLPDRVLPRADIDAVARQWLQQWGPTP